MTALRGGDGYVVITDRDGDGLHLEPVVEHVVGEQPFVAMLHALVGEQTVVTVGLTFDDGLAVLQALADALKVERYVLGDCTKLHADDVERGARAHGILALVDEVEAAVELLRELVEQQRPVELVSTFVDGPRLDSDVPFVEDPDPLAHDHCGLCAQCAAPRGTCCPHCSGARIGSSGRDVLADRGAGGRG